MHIYNRCVEGVEIYFLIYSFFYTLPYAIWISTCVGDYYMTTTIAVRTYAGTSRRRTHDIIKNKEQNSSVFIALAVRTGIEPVRVAHTCSGRSILILPSTSLYKPILPDYIAP